MAELNLGHVRGADGVGVPAGGDAGQVLRKSSAIDYDTEWLTQLASHIGTSTPGVNVQAALDGKQALLNSSNPLPISGGGHGGNTAAAGRTNLELRSGATTRVEYGSFSVTIPTNDYVDTAVTFGAAFGSAPRIFSGVGTAGAARYVRLAAYASTTGGTIRAFNELTSGEITLTINWHVVGV